MNELLTKGIGHTEFKDSELGRIPKNWKENFSISSDWQLLREESSSSRNFWDGDVFYLG